MASTKPPDVVGSHQPPATGLRVPSTLAASPGGELGPRRAPELAPTGLRCRVLVILWGQPAKVPGACLAELSIIDSIIFLAAGAAERSLSSPEE